MELSDQLYPTADLNREDETPIPHWIGHNTHRQRNLI